jgi:tetratricopeptide (TPR) repeat protein
LGLVAISQGDIVQAAKLTEEAVALFRELGSRGDVSLSLNNLGWIAFLRNDLGKAVDLYKQSMALAWETGMYTVVLDDLVGFACLAGAQGDAVRAAQLCGAAEALHEATGYPQDPISHAEMEPYLASGRSKVHEAVWEEAWEEGRTMTLEEAVSYALEEEASG